MRRFAALALAAAAILLAGPACDRVTPVAPVGATITLSINPSRIAAQGEDATVTAIVRKEDGTPVNPGTQVNFSTTLGTLNPEVSNTDETGVAKTILTGDGRIGTATVTATTGAAAAVAVEVQIGSVAASITLNATPSDVSKNPPPAGEVIQLLALIRDDTGAPLEGNTVSFDADIGSLASGGAAVMTNELGEARDSLTVTRNNISVLFEPSFFVRAETAIAGGNLISDEVQIDIRGVAATITLQGTPTTVPTAGGDVDLLALVRDNLGDPLEGASVNFLTDVGALDEGGSAINTNSLGQAMEILRIRPQDTAGLTGRTFRVRAQTGGFGGEILEAVEEIQIQSGEPVAAFTFAKGSADGRTVNFTFTGTGDEPLVFKWDFDTADGDSTGTGTPDSTARNPPFTYLTDGPKIVKLVVSNVFPNPSTATASIQIPLP